MKVWSRLAVDTSAGLRNLDPFAITKDDSPTRGQGQSVIPVSSYPMLTRDKDGRLRAVSFRPLFAAAIVFASIFPLHAQYQGLQQIGLAGLEAGTQPAPGVYVTIPLDYRFSNISLYNAQGRQVLRNLTADVNVIVVPGLREGASIAVRP